ncbi:MAG: radical SAM protein [Candidatus Hodarchaeales archaeon]|jgi:radical SAM protein with 4Fe4S-binding SPASM domain
MTVNVKYEKILLYIPSNLLFQWHITERCNLRCSHCYQETYQKKELSFDQLTEIFNQFLEIIEFWREMTGKKIKSHITLTGGEPFIRKDFEDILKLISTHNSDISLGILTNGHFIDQEKAKFLKKIGTKFVQVSIEGKKETHDQIRGKKSYERAVQGLKYLVKEKINTMISFTAHRNNYQEFPDVAELGRQLGVSKVWSDRLIPSGSGMNLIKDMLTVEETQEYFKLMKNQGNQTKKRKHIKTEIALDRALQFLEGWGKPYTCTAGDSLITVQANGDLLPCRRMPIPTGNLLENKLIDLYYKNTLFKRLRQKDLVNKGCEDCFYAKVCRGGLKCLSYALTNDPFNADPQCWLASEKRQLPNLDITTIINKETESTENQAEFFIPI